MTMHDKRRIARRSYLRGAGVTLATLGGMTGSVVAGRGKGGEGPRQLEETPSKVDFVIFAGEDGNNDRDVADPEDFVFPLISAGAGEENSEVFNTTFPTITPNDKTMHYFLQFGASQPKPYILLHEGDGTYTSRGAVMNFEWSGDGRFNFPFPEGKYRGVVRDVVQLYEPGGYFDWSVTRTDFFSRNSGMRHVLSLLYIVWDEDGDDNDTPTNRGSPGIPADPTAPPDFPGPSEVTPTVDGETILTVADSLITSGVANPGGQ